LTLIQILSDKKTVSSVSHLPSEGYRNMGMPQRRGNACMPPRVSEYFSKKNRKKELGVTLSFIVKLSPLS
jgi:hypothetical protein